MSENSRGDSDEVTVLPLPNTLAPDGKKVGTFVRGSSVGTSFLSGPILNVRSNFVAKPRRALDRGTSVKIQRITAVNFMVFVACYSCC